jgi:hypothetical protein
MTYHIAIKTEYGQFCCLKYDTKKQFEESCKEYNTNNLANSEKQEPQEILYQGEDEAKCISILRKKVEAISDDPEEYAKHLLSALSGGLIE